MTHKVWESHIEEGESIEQSTIHCCFLNFCIIFSLFSVLGTFPNWCVEVFIWLADSRLTTSCAILLRHLVNTNLKYLKPLQFSSKSNSFTMHPITGKKNTLLMLILDKMCTFSVTAWKFQFTLRLIFDLQAVILIISR